MPVHSHQKVQPFWDTGHQEQPPSVLACNAESIQLVGLALSLGASFTFLALWCMLPVSLGVHGWNVSCVKACECSSPTFLFSLPFNHWGKHFPPASSWGGNCGTFKNGYIPTLRSLLPLHLKYLKGKRLSERRATFLTNIISLIFLHNPLLFVSCL